MGGIGGPELLLVLLVVLIVFGPRKIPEISRMMGRGLREFRRLSTEFQRELNIADALEGNPPPGHPPTRTRPGEEAPAPPPSSDSPAGPPVSDEPRRD